MSLTMGEITQLNCDLAELQAKVKNCVGRQRMHWMFAFGLFEAPSEKTEKVSFDTYWDLEKDIQDTLTKIQKIKEKLR